jgi:abortive infection bacteriophage resistance protein
MDKIELEKEIIKYNSLIKLYEAMYHNAKTKMERSIQTDRITEYEAVLAKLLSLR